MKNINDIKNRIEKENVNFYDVGLSTDVLINGIDLFSIDNFIDFVRSQKINVVFGSELLEDAEDYLITDEIIERELGRYNAEEMYDIIINDIENYNKKVCEIDFSIPFLYIFACLYNGKYIFVKMKVDRGIDDKFLIEPEDRLKEIVLNNEKNIQMKRQETHEIVNQLKKELREIIVNDEKFIKCTNKKLRMNYIKDLLTNRLDEHFEPLRKLWIAETVRGIYQDPIDFVELIWREIN